MDQQQTIAYLLQHTATMLDRQQDQIIQEKIGIGLAQLRILRAVEMTPHIRQNQMAAQLGQTEASVSRQVKLLQDKGLLVMEVNAENRREHMSSITAKGQRMAEAAQSAIDSYMAPILARLNDKQQQYLLGTLISVHSAICQNSKLTACNHPFTI